MKRRTLVLHDEGARHPFLQSLPPHVRRVEPEAPAKPRLRLTWSDLRQFLTAYCATFAAVMVFVS